MCRIGGNARQHFSEPYARPIEIENNVWIGGGCILLPGVTIGENSVIGAGSVVTRPVPPNCVAVGESMQQGTALF
ncbi:MAG: DapH/DapD/GlmU-related protein [Ruminococcus sp.]